MKPLRLVVVLLVAAVAAAPAAATPALTKNEYIRKADRVCAVYRARMARIPVRPTQPSLRQNGPAFLALAREQLAKLRLLGPPRSARPILALWQQKNDAFADDVAAAQAGIFDYANSRVDAIGYRLSRAKAAYGFRIC